MSTYTLISSQVLGSSAASVTFSSIPQTYKDLVLRVSARSDAASITENFSLTFNGSSASNYSFTYIQGDGSSPISTNQSNVARISERAAVGNGATSNTFGNSEIYIPSYTLSQYKPISSIGVGETNGSTAYIQANAGLWSVTSAITSITFNIQNGTNILSGSSFYLYGV